MIVSLINSQIRLFQILSWKGLECTSVTITRTVVKLRGSLNYFLTELIDNFSVLSRTF